MRIATLIAGTAALTLACTTVAEQKVRLFQEFTSTSCVYCPDVAQGLNIVLDDNPDTTIGIMIHGSDNYTTTLGNQLMNFYNLSGYPTVWLDGTWSQVGSYGSPAANATTLANLLNNAASTTDVSINVVGTSISSNQYGLDITVSVEAGGSNRNMRLYITQVYDQENWPESNEIQFNTLRQSAPTVDMNLAPGASQTLNHVFTLSGESLNTEYVNYIVWAQLNNSSAPAMVYQANQHKHGEAPPADVTVGPFGDYTTIQAALDDVGSGSTVTVAAGIYNESLDFNGRSIHLVAASAGDPSQTVIDAGGTGRVLTLMGGSSGSMNGFTVTGGHATTGSAMITNGSPDISNCVFRNNTSTNYVVISGGMPSFANNHFCGNEPDNQIGGLWNDAGGNDFDTSCGDEPCDGDYNADGMVNVDDILTVLGGFGGQYNVDDLLTCLANFGESC